MKVELPDGVLVFLRKHCSVFNSRNSFVKSVNVLHTTTGKQFQYYFLPYWVRVDSDNDKEADIVMWDKLPDDLKEFIQRERDPKFIQDQQKAIKESGQ